MIYNDILERTGASSATISRVTRSMEPLKTFLHILRMQKIIQTVQTAHGGVHRPVEVQLRHIFGHGGYQTFFERQAEQKERGEEEP